jgi:hypothetical protein
VLWAGSVTHILLDLLRLSVDSTCFSRDISLFGALVDVPQLFNVFFTCIPAFVPIHKVSAALVFQSLIWHVGV